YLVMGSGALSRPRTFSLYSYTSHNPLGYIDPDGMRTYAAARDLAGAAIIGTHQFIVLIPDNPEDFDDARMAELGLPPLRNLGTNENPKMGIVVGAHNEGGQLHVRFNEESDFQAAREAFGGAERGIRPDFSPE